MHNALIEYGSHYANRTLYVYCIKNYVGTQGEDLSTVKVFLPSGSLRYRPFEAAVSWFYSYFVWLSGFYYGAVRVESCLALCSRVVVFLFFVFFCLFFFLLFFFLVILALSHSDHLAWGRESWSMYLVHLFVYFACVDVCPFSFPLGVRGWLWLVIVALPGLFYYFFCGSFYGRMHVFNSMKTI